MSSSRRGSTVRGSAADPAGFLPPRRRCFFSAGGVPFFRGPKSRRLWHALRTDFARERVRSGPPAPRLRPRPSGAGRVLSRRRPLGRVHPRMEESLCSSRLPSVSRRPVVLFPPRLSALVFFPRRVRGRFFSASRLLLRSLRLPPLSRRCLLFWPQGLARPVFSPPASACLRVPARRPRPLRLSLASGDARSCQRAWPTLFLVSRGPRELFLFSRRAPRLSRTLFLGGSSLRAGRPEGNVLSRFGSLGGEGLRRRRWWLECVEDEFVEEERERLEVGEAEILFSARAGEAAPPPGSSDEAEGSCLEQWCCDRVEVEDGERGAGAGREARGAGMARAPSRGADARFWSRQRSLRLLRGGTVTDMRRAGDMKGTMRPRGKAGRSERV